MIFSFFQSKFLWGNAFFALCFLLKAYFWFSDYFREKEKIQKFKEKEDEIHSRLFSLSCGAQAQLLYIYERLKHQHSLPMPFNSSVIFELCDGKFIRRASQRVLIVGVDTICYDYLIEKDISDYIAAHYEELKSAGWGAAPAPIFLNI